MRKAALLASAFLLTGSVTARTPQPELQAPLSPLYNSVIVQLQKSTPLSLRTIEASVGECLSRGAMMASLAVVDSNLNKGELTAPSVGACLQPERFNAAIKEHGKALEKAGLMTPETSVDQALQFLSTRKVINLGVTYRCEPTKAPAQAAELAIAAQQMFAQPLEARVPVNPSAVAAVCFITAGEVSGSLLPADSVSGLAEPPRFHRLPLAPPPPRSASKLMV